MITLECYKPLDIPWRCRTKSSTSPRDARSVFLLLRTSGSLWGDIYKNGKSVISVLGFDSSHATCKIHDVYINTLSTTVKLKITNAPINVKPLGGGGGRA